MTASTAILLGLAATGLTEVMARRREARAARHYAPSGHFRDIEGVRLHAEILGEQGPDVVLIHGSSGSLRDFTFSLAPRLANDFRVIAIDRPGLGWSGPHPDGERLSTQARLIRALAADLGADRPIVVGQSYGGAVGLSWAIDAPDSLAALVTIGGVAMPWTTGLGTYYSLTSHPLGQRVIIPLITAFVPGQKVKREVEAVFAPQEAPEGYVDFFGPDIILRRVAMRENARQRSVLLEDIRDLHHRYGEITVPVEILHGEEDTIVPAKLHALGLAERVPNGHLTLLPGIGHMPQHAAEDEVVATIHRAAARAGLQSGGKSPY